jgi:hypothetical protein
MMAFEPLFLLALLVLIFGNGAFKPNISTQVGTLYAPGDPRRDRAFSIFYVGINLGAFLAPLICGTLGEEIGWHYGFGAAGIGMTIGLSIYLYASRTLPPDVRSRVLPKARPAVRPRRMARHGRAHAAGAAGDVLLGHLRAAGQHHRAVGRRLHRPHHQPAVWAGQIPVTWFQAFNPFMIFAFTPFILALWKRQERNGREPSTVMKMASAASASRRLPDPGRARVQRRRRQGELALARGLFRRPHHRRALSVAGRPFAGHQGGAGPRRVDDDGRVARHELHRQLPRGLPRQLLVEHGQGLVLHDDRGDRGAGRPRHSGVRAAVEADARASRSISRNEREDYQ